MRGVVDKEYCMHLSLLLSPVTTTMSESKLTRTPRKFKQYSGSVLFCSSSVVAREGKQRKYLSTIAMAAEKRGVSHVASRVVSCCPVHKLASHFVGPRTH